MRVTGQLIAAADEPARPGSLVVDQGRIATLDFDAEAASAGFIVPGLIDAHLHPLETGLELLLVNLAGAGSIAEVQERFRQRQADALEWGTMLGFNLEPDELAESRYPTRQELDRVTGDVPALAYRVDGHSAVTNTAGLRILSGLSTIGSDVDGHGSVTGVLRGPAYEQASRQFKHRLTPELVRQALRRCGELAVSRGVTTIAALIGTEDTTDAEFRVMLDALAEPGPAAVPFLQTWRHETAREFGLGRIGGCLLMDGSFGSHTAALARDYSDAPGNRGMAFVPDARLARFVRRSEELGLQTAFHAIGDRAVEQVVRCHEQLGTPGPNLLRHRIEHAELLNPGLVERIARLGLVLGVQPAFEATWGGPDRMYSRRLGDRWRMTNPFRSLLGAGVLLAGGSDSPITPIDPLSGIRAAVEHPNPDQRITPEQALAMFTSGAAFSLGLDDRTGSLKPGAGADFTVLTSDPRRAGDCRVAATFSKGRCLFKDDALSEYVRLY